MGASGRGGRTPERCGCCTGNALWRAERDQTSASADNRSDAAHTLRLWCWLSPLQDKEMSSTDVTHGSKLGNTEKEDFSIMTQTRSSPMMMSLVVWKSCSSSQVGCSAFRMSQTLLCSLSHMVAYMVRPGRMPNISWPMTRRFSGGIPSGYTMCTGTSDTVGGYISPFTNWEQRETVNKKWDKSFESLELTSFSCHCLLDGVHGLFIKPPPQAKRLLDKDGLRKFPF